MDWLPSFIGQSVQLLIVSHNYFNQKKKKIKSNCYEQFIIKLYQDLLNNKLKRRLFSKSNW